MKIDILTLAPIVLAAAPASYRPLIEAAIGEVQARREKEAAMLDHIRNLTQAVNDAHGRINLLVDRINKLVPAVSPVTH